jgi:hypothetical protein
LDPEESQLQKELFKREIKKNNLKIIPKGK